jgi:hypothetical protein
MVMRDLQRFMIKALLHCEKASSETLLDGV